MAHANKHEPSREHEMRQYMLDQLSDQEERRLEERLTRVMSTDEGAREVQELSEIVQDQLVEDYLAGALGKQETAVFEERFLGSARIDDRIVLDQLLVEAGRRKMERLGWSKRIAQWLFPSPQPGPAAVTPHADGSSKVFQFPGLQPALAAVAASVVIVAVAGGVWSAGRIGQLEDQLRQADAQISSQESLQADLSETREQLDRTTSRLAELEQKLKATANQASQALATFILLPGIQRGVGATGTVTIPSGQDLVELKLDIGLDEYEDYQAELLDSSGSELMRQSRLSVVSENETDYVVLQLPGVILTADDYRVELSGVTAEGQLRRIDSYRFRVAHQ